ncbi:Protein of unknown function DUF247, partial [Theobroma cacao]
KKLTSSDPRSRRYLPLSNFTQLLGHNFQIFNLLQVAEIEQITSNSRLKLETEPKIAVTLGLELVTFEFGLKFVKVTPDSILDIKFRDGSLEIPSLLIQETTETILRNLIAYEQCLPHCPPIFTCYAKVLDNLIDTTNDMEILCKSEIFDNWLSPEDATQFFNRLYNDTYVKEFYYSKLCDELDGYCKRWWPTWRAYYVHNYFSKPWAIAAQIYAVI